MTTYYADTAGSNTSPYDTWAKAATDIQTVADLATAGDVIYCRGTQTLSTAITFDINAGTQSGGHIKVVGCNASGNVDGTNFVLDANSTATQCVSLSRDYLWLENLEFKNATGDGFEINGNLQGIVGINLYSHDNSGSGFELYQCYPDMNMFIRCRAIDNASQGFYYPGTYPARFEFCEAIGNLNGFESIMDSVLYGCIAHGNTYEGIDFAAEGGMAINCVVDGNGRDGIQVRDDACQIIGCRITNNGAYGIDVDAGKRVMAGYSFFGGNFTADMNGNVDVLPYNSDADTNETSGTEGYTDRANDDFNLTSSATLRSVAVELY